jgi:hypothetical protein
VSDADTVGANAQALTTRDVSDVSAVGANAHVQQAGSSGGDLRSPCAPRRTGT